MNHKEEIMDSDLFGLLLTCNLGSLFEVPSLIENWSATIVEVLDELTQRRGKPVKFLAFGFQVSPHEPFSFFLSSSIRSEFQTDRLIPKPKLRFH